MKRSLNTTQKWTDWFGINQIDDDFSIIKPLIRLGVLIVVGMILIKKVNFAVLPVND